MFSRFRFLLLLLAIVGLPHGARAQEGFLGYLDGPSVNPPNASPATGFSQMTRTGDFLEVYLAFSGLMGASTAAHIHCCTPPPANAGVAVFYTGIPLGVTAGTYGNTFDLTNAATYNAAFITAHGGTTAGAEAALLAALATGEAYVCVHTTLFPGSEIRAFVIPILFIDGFETGDSLEWSLTVP